jgi:hypothetical protein
LGYENNVKAVGISNASRPIAGLPVPRGVSPGAGLSELHRGPIPAGKRRTGWTRRAVALSLHQELSMHPAVSTLLGVIGQTGQTVLGAGALRAPATFSRAQVSTSVTARGADGIAWSEFSANTARFTGVAQRLLIEGQRTNALRNPRCEGTVLGVAGSGGVAPTHWTASPPTGAISTEIVAVGTTGGLPYVDVRFFGTASGASGGTTYLMFEPTTAIVTTPSTAWVAGVFVQRIAGDGVTGSPTLVLREGLAAGGLVTSTGTSLSGVSAAALQRVEIRKTLAGTTERVTMDVRFSYALGAVVDVTFRFAAPQLEQGAFSSTPILPPVGTPAASTRGTDSVTATRASLGIAANGACTLLWSGMIPQAAPAGVAQTILQFDDGTANNRYLLRNVAGGSAIAVNRVTAGAAAGDISLGTMTPGTPFRAGITINAAGRIAGCLNGGAAVAITGGPTSGLTALRLGNDTAGTTAMFGETASLRVLPFALTDASLPGAVMALPD